jgi:hypothetical protein
MAANKRPRKPMKHRELRIPAIMDVRYIGEEEPMLAMQIYGRIEAFLTDPNAESSENLSEMLAHIAAGLYIQSDGKGVRHMKDAHTAALISAVRAMEDISAREIKFGVIRPTDLEAQTLRAAAGHLDGALNRIPVHFWNAGKQDVRRIVANVDMQRARSAAAQAIVSA